MTIQVIGWAIIHSLWQGGIIVAIAAALFALTRRQAASVRYVIGLVGLALMLALPVATAMRSATTAPQAADIPGSFENTLASAASPSASRNGSVSADSPPLSSAGIPSANDGSASTRGNGFFASLTDLASRLSALTVLLPWVVAGWIVGLFIASIRLLGGLTRTRRLTRRGVSPASDRLRAAADELSQRVGVRRVVRLLESTLTEVPLVIGIVRPVIVIPASLMTGLTPMQLHMLVAHELAHIRRYDFAANLAQTVIDTLLFYHPGVRWLSERVREERENCCDDIALAVTGGDKRTYTDTLLTLEEARSGDFGLAAAATGGSLLRRARRLLIGEPAHLELGPRWIAGVFTIAAALFTGREAMGTGIESSFVPVAVTADSDGEEEISQDKERLPDARRASPSTVVRAPAGTFRDRWRWAEQRGRELRSPTYWVGYLVAGDRTGRERYYLDRELPVHMDQSTFYGRMRLGDGDLSTFRFHGVPLSPLVGPHDPTSTAIFLRMSARSGSPRVERIHVATFFLPVHFDRAPLIWLDSAGDRESIELARSLQNAVRTEEDRRDVVALVGIHRDNPAVLPLLIGWLEDRSQPEGVRREAAEWLGKKSDPRAVAALSRVARNDPSKGVRHEAIEAFSHMPIASATDSLISFAQTIRDLDLVRVALEALGHRSEPQALTFLERMARSASDYQLRIEAVEALAEIPDGRGMTAVIAIARSDAPSDIRHKAVESLGEMEPASRALDLLLQIARNDPDEAVRREAVETIAEVHDARSVGILRDLANGNYDEDLQVEAVESLGETVAPREALTVLRAIARSHPRAEIRKKAVETIGDMRE